MNSAATRQAMASFRRVRLIARFTLREALHLRLTTLLGLLAAGLVLGGMGLREFNFGGAELKFIGDFGLGALGGFGMLLAALATAHLFFSEIQGRAAYCVLTRPVRRWEYIWGKLVGVGALLAWFVGALGLLIAIMVFWRGLQLGVAMFSLPVFFCACAVQWLKLTLVAAMTLLVCSYSGSAMFASCTGLIVAVIAHLRPLVPEVSSLAWLRMLPNLAAFDAEALLASAQLPARLVVLAAIGYWAAYVVLFGVLAALVFNRREF